MSNSEPTLPVREIQWSPGEVEERLAALHQSRSTGKRRAKQLKVTGLLLSCAAALAALGWTELSQDRLVTASSSLQMPVQSGSVEARPGEEDSRIISFPDGSTAQLLSPESRLKMSHVSRDAVRVELPEGEAHFRVTPSDSRAFVVDARGILVTVLGTEFVIRHESTRSHVRVIEGRVSVEGPGKKRILTGGEAAWFEVRSALLKREQESSGRELDSSEQSFAAAEEGARTSARAGQESQREQFIEHHRKGEYKKAYKILSSHPGAVGTGARDLMRAADAARFAGHPAEAATYLNQIGDTGPMATTAAFTLGRLYLYQLGDPAQAARHFARAGRLAAGGPLAEDALYREVEARVRAGQMERASELGKKYRKRYPQSRRAESVARLTRVP